jgi:hypothetical protein
MDLGVRVRGPNFLEKTPRTRRPSPPQKMYKYIYLWILLFHQLYLNNDFFIYFINCI